MKELRERAGIQSQEEAAYRLGVSLGSIRNWEQGKKEPTLGITKTKRILDVYKCTFDELAEAVKSTSKNKK